MIGKKSSLVDYLKAIWGFSGEEFDHVQMLQPLAVEAPEAQSPSNIISTYDNMLASEAQSCYRSKLNRSAQVIYAIEEASVQYVNLLNYDANSSEFNFY